MRLNRYYYERRARQEAMAARHALTAKGQEWHRELAEMFQKKAQQEPENA